jgi:hypothetical protein
MKMKLPGKLRAHTVFLLIMSLLLVSRVLHYYMGHYDDRQITRNGALTSLGHSVAGKLRGLDYSGFAVKTVSYGAEGENGVYAVLSVAASDDEILKLREEKLSDAKLRSKVCSGRDKLALSYVDRIRISYVDEKGREITGTAFGGC